MKRALFITIGTRDITLDKKIFAEKTDPKKVKNCYRKKAVGFEQLLARPAGELIIEHLSQLKRDLKFPIIEPFLKYLEINDSPLFDEVFLIATDQDPEIVREYAKTDTIHFAEILKRLLPGKYKVNGETGFNRISVIPVKGDVIYIDSMFNFFNDLLKRRKYSYLNEYDEIHLLNQGGIDAINYGLLLNALYLYGKKNRLYTVNELGNLCTPLDFGTQFVNEQEKILLLQAIERYDYSYAKLTGISIDAATWAAYAEARLNFDFDTAYQRLSQLSTSLREKQVQELLDIEKVRENTQNLTAELYWNAMIRFKQEAYVDFVQRFFRIVEQYAQTKALSYIKKLDYDPKQHHYWEKKIIDFLEKPENAKLKKHLEESKVGNDSKLDISKPNIPVFMSILKFYNPKEHDFIQQLVPLSRIRNKGIGAHGFEPVSLKQILETLSLKREEFEGLLMKTGKKLKVLSNPFERINENIAELVT
ncbi:hypothetical protein [Phaeodactylibacter xiamenensis]|uniref:hypothetical protein n=1 Tax=Phaeodactylibacter xiamenensis TaxID=1524460 RepID=UPI0024A9D32E|nr:hypothetical protein [Phaeodactylibacter xiamenensis]